METEQDVTQELVEPENVEQEVVQPEPQETEASTPEQDVTQEEQRVPYTRFKDAIEEKNYYKELLEKQLAQRQERPQQTQPQQDPYASMTPEEERFWRAVDQRADQRAEKKIAHINAALQMGIKRMASIETRQLRKDYPDLAPGSPEEKEAAKLINQGYPADHAIKLALFDKTKEKASSKAKTAQQQKIVQKRLANTETSPGVSTSSIPNKAESIEETFLRLAKEEGVALPPSL